MSVSPSINLPKMRFSQRTTVAAQIYQFLRQVIVDTTVRPGGLLSENGLSEHFSVSRQPIRDALQRLSTEGLVTIMPQRGTTVRPVSILQTEHNIFVRYCIEEGCLKRFGELEPRSRRTCINQLERSINKARELPEDDENRRLNLMALDDAFHKAICDISGSELAWNTVSTLTAQSDRISYLALSLTEPDYNQIIIDDHRKIVECLKNNDLTGAIEGLRQTLNQPLEIYKYIIAEAKYEDWFSDYRN